MDFSSLLIRTSPQFFYALFFCLFALALWFIIRKKKQSQWLPILRVIKVDARQLPRLRIKLPPLIIFLLFLSMVSAFIFLITQPVNKTYESSASGPIRSHIFFDLSPSSAGQWDSDDLKRQLLILSDRLIIDGRLTVSHSGDFNINEVSSVKAFSGYFDSLKVHRAGLKISHAINQQLSKLKDIDRLIIISDADRYSWTGFNWRYLEEKMNISWYPVIPIDQKKVNTFIQDIRMLDIDDKASRSWEVEIARTSAETDISGVLSVTAGDGELKRKTWRMGPGLTQIKLSIELGQDVLRKQIENNSDENQMTDDEAILLEWKLNDLNVSGNSILVDDVFYTSSRPFEDNILLVSEPQGEMFLEDVMHHPQLMLELLGFRIDRFQDWPQEKINVLDYGLWLLVGGNRANVVDFCPSRLESIVKKRPASNPLKSGINERLNIWLFPGHIDTNYAQLCHCYAVLTDRDLDGDSGLPNYCKSVETRDQYIAVLQSLGAVQVGGQVDNQLNALAWEWSDEDLNTNILAFTIPPKPSVKNGLSYSDLPKVFSALLERSGVIKNQGATMDASGVKRISDISSLDSSSSVGLSFRTIEVSNVPVGESVLKVIETTSMPQIWNFDDINKGTAQSLAREKEDPLPWIKSIFLLVSFITFVEAFYLLIRKIIQNRKNANKLVLFLVIGYGCWHGSPLRADVKLNLLGYDNSKMEAKSLSGDVAGRTSITLDEEVSYHSTVTQDLFLQGWIWSRNKGFILDKRGQLIPEVAGWLRRGGFLVIENFQEGDNKGISLVSGRSPDDGWKPIPPDHEIMRSFHLLDSLPSCQGSTWWGYQFDGRISIVAIPYSVIELLVMNKSTNKCFSMADKEVFTRIFINVLMVALTTDYKKDQIHLPEILKRLR